MGGIGETGPVLFPDERLRVFVVYYPDGSRREVLARDLREAALAQRSGPVFARVDRKR